MNRRWADVAAVASVVALHLFLYRKVVRLWWTYDDANILRTLFYFPWHAPFTDVAVWPQQLFTPLMIVAFDVQYTAFGLDPTPFYVVQLTIAVVAALLCYATMRHFFRVGASLSAAALYTAGVPLVSVVTQLSTVHYFVAIIFGALATIAWVRGRPLLSALLYLLAMLAKEVACPLPLLFLALPLRDVRTRMRWLVLHSIAAVGYLAWRRAVLGTFTGAYGWVIEGEELPRLLAELPWRVVQAMAGIHLPLGLTLVALLLAAIVYAARKKQALLVILAAALIVVLPLLLVAKEVNRRYVVVPWLAYSVAAVAGIAGIRNRRITATLLVAAPLLAIVVNRQEWGREFAVRQRMSDEARFFFELPPNGVLRHPAVPPSVMLEVNTIKTFDLEKPAGAAWFYDDLYLCNDPNVLAGKQVYEYEERRRMLVDVTARMPQVARTHCSAIRHDAPLTARFHYRKPALHWDLGPHDAGQYHAVIANGYQAFPVPRRDALNLPGVNALSLRIRYDSPEGWTTYSPEIPMDFTKGTEFAWKR
ncbi:MAG TPA: hypothetical protein VF618_03010 [Thermoanaerobaculia bacterium]